MKKSFFVISALLCLLALGCVSSAMADSVVIPDTEFSGWGIGDAQFAYHEDVWPFKGSAYVRAKNTGTRAWTDFHFEIIPFDGNNVSQVYFVTNDGEGNYTDSSQSGFNYTITDNALGTAKVINLYFTNNPVAIGQTAWFQIYTNNQASEADFGLKFYPTVPEPSSLLALSGSLIGLAGFALRRRK